MNNYCHSIGAFMDVLDIIIRFEFHVNECIVGVFGWINEPDDILDCFWKYYRPVLPIYEISFVDEGDMSYDYMQWNCNFEDYDAPIISLDKNGNEVIEVDGELVDIEDVIDGGDIPLEPTNITI